MGKRIIQQARGKGSLTYRVRKKAFIYKVKYPMSEGEAEVLKLIHSAGHSAPLMKIKVGNEIFYNVAFSGVVEGQKILIGGNSSTPGSIIALKEVQQGARIYNLERNPGDGGKMIRSAGMSVMIGKRYGNKVGVIMPSRKEILLNGDCRITIGVIAGGGKGKKPIMKAGVNYYKHKAKGKLYPRTSAVKMNAVDHPFGSGRGKRPKPKIAQRNAPPGRKVGHLRPRRTGRKK